MFLTWCLAARALVTYSTIVAIQALATVAFAMSMSTAEAAYRANTLVHIPTALTCSACAVGFTVTHSTSAVAKAWGGTIHRVKTMHQIPLKYARHILQLTHHNL